MENRDDRAADGDRGAGGGAGHHLPTVRAGTPGAVFEAWTKPEHLTQWLGPAYLELSVCEIDLRVGGAYRLVHRAPDGTEHGFYGEYLEVVRPSRLVMTFIYEGMPDARSVDASTSKRPRVGRCSMGPAPTPRSLLGTSTSPTGWRRGA